jgi:anthranilate synthase/aminodeoxychorismate synthase-like glutamine amidotransferase
VSSAVEHRAPRPETGTILVVDNYDSFVYNIVQLLPLECEHVEVLRNDRVTAAEVADDPRLRAVVISPGPMGPKQAGASVDVLRAAAHRGLPVLGICLGHQCIAEAFGASVARHPTPVHGKASLVALSPDPLFDGLPSVIEAGRYHSLHVVEDGLESSGLRVVARVLDDGTVMAVRHRTLPVVGVQFHPESVLTGEWGRRILANFVSTTQAPARLAAGPLAAVR